MNHPLCMGYRVSIAVTCAITHAIAVGHDDHPYEGVKSGDSIWQSGLVIRIATTCCSGNGGCGYYMCKFMYGMLHLSNMNLHGKEV